MNWYSVGNPSIFYSKHNFSFGCEWIVWCISIVSHYIGIVLFDFRQRFRIFARRTSPSFWNCCSTRRALISTSLTWSWTPRCIMPPRVDKSALSKCFCPPAKYRLTRRMCLVLHPWWRLPSKVMWDAQKCYCLLVSNINIRVPPNSWH